MTCAQGFATLNDLCMRIKGDVYLALNILCITVGLPLTIVTDNATEEYGGNWETNKAELEIRD